MIEQINANEYIVTNLIKFDKNYTLWLAPRNYSNVTSGELHAPIKVKNPDINLYLRDKLCIGDRILYNEHMRRIVELDPSTANKQEEKMLVTGAEISDFNPTSSLPIKKLIAIGQKFGELSFNIYGDNEFYYTNRGDILLVAENLDGKIYIKENLTMAKMRQDFLINQR